MLVDSKRARRVDGVFGNKALDALIVTARSALFRHASALFTHLAGELPGAADDLIDPSHALPIGAEHGDRTDIVQYVLRRDGLGAHPAFGERDIFGHRRIEMVAHHDHVEMFVESVAGVGIGRVGRRRQAVGFAGDADDIWRMAAASALGVVHMNSAAFDCGQRVFEESAFVQRVGMQLDLEIHFIGNRETAIDGGRHGAPVFMDLQPHRTAGELIR